jgi:hypothetical protein
VATVSCVKNRRAFVQPSGADRASLVDVPSTYQDENHFTPRPGKTYQPFRHSCVRLYSSQTCLASSSKHFGVKIP